MARKKRKDLNNYANEASAAGLTYGQKQAREYLEKVVVGPVPEGYTKVGNRRKKHE